MIYEIFCVFMFVLNKCWEYWISLLYLIRLPWHFYLVVIKFIILFIFFLWEKTRNFTHDKSFLNLVKLNKIWIVITFSRLIWDQTEFRLVTNQREKYNYNPNLIRFEIVKIFFCIKSILSRDYKATKCVWLWLFISLFFEIVNIINKIRFKILKIFFCIKSCFLSWL